MPSEAEEEEVAQQARLVPTAGSLNVTTRKREQKDLSLCCRFPATSPAVISRGIAGRWKPEFEKAYYYCH